MLTELHGVRQHPGEAPRRAFWDDYFQLYVWLEKQAEIIGFELSYDLLDNCRAFRWTPGDGIQHYRVDDGEDRAMKKAIPILRPDHSSIDPHVLQEFDRRSAELEPSIRKLVAAKLQELLTTPGSHPSG